MFYSTEYDSPLGKITLACNRQNSLAGLWLAGQKYFSSVSAEPMPVDNNPPVFQQVKLWLDRYFAGQNPNLAELPLAPVGSSFRQQVWQILRAIPYGKVTTYGEIAKKIAARQGRGAMSAQAVGGAVGHNPISIIIPCHRVVGANGGLTGYAGGLALKSRLLELEGVAVRGGYVDLVKYRI